jgi:hypothetical protein
MQRARMWERQAWLATIPARAGGDGLPAAAQHRLRGQRAGHARPCIGSWHRAMESKDKNGQEGALRQRLGIGKIDQK